VKQLILMVGGPGSGKSHYIKGIQEEHTLISQDENNGDKTKTLEQFEKALLTSDTIVVDRMNFDREQRASFIAPARAAGFEVSAFIVWRPFIECYHAIINREGHKTIPKGDSETALKVLRFFKKMYKRPTLDEVDDIKYVNEFLYGESDWYMRDFSHLYKPILAIGDVHGCHDEWREMDNIMQGMISDYITVFAGDIVDKGPKVAEMLDSLVFSSNRYSILGNHDWKVLRYLRGNKVKPDSIKETLDSIKDWTDKQKFFLMLNLEEMIPIAKLRKDVYMVHAGIKTKRSVYDQNFQDLLYLRSDSPRGLMNDPNAPLWFEADRKHPEEVILFGHNADAEGDHGNNTIGLDSGCVYGNTLTGRLIPVDQNKKPIVSISVKAKKTYYERSRDVGKAKELLK